MGFTFCPEVSMKVMGPLILIFSALSLAAAESVKEFESNQGLARIEIVSQDTGSWDTAPNARLVSVPMNELLSIPEYVGQEELVLDIYYLDKLDGAELHFPARYSQLCLFLTQHAGKYGKGNDQDRAVAFIRDFSQDQHIRMETNDVGGSVK
jgi:hypothetical protein